VGEKLFAYGDSAIIVFCPQAAWPHLADVGASTTFAADPAARFGVGSLGNLLHRVILTGVHHLTFQDRVERTPSCCTTAGRGFVTVVFEKTSDSSPRI